MISNEQKKQDLIANAYYREQEVYQYQVNIDNYTVMLAALPQDNWREDLAKYKNVKTEDLPWDMSDEDVQLVNDYQYRDRIRSLLRTEKVEQGKAQRVLDALKVQIGPTADADINAFVPPAPQA